MINFCLFEMRYWSKKVVISSLVNPEIKKKIFTEMFLGGMKRQISNKKLIYGNGLA